MFTTIATLEYLLDTENEFCSLAFIGMDDDMVFGMTDSWNRVKNERKRDGEAKIETYKNRIAELRIEIADLTAAYSASKKWYRPKTLAERQIVIDMKDKNIEIETLEAEIVKISKRTEFSTKTLKNKAHELLLKNGFVLISKSETNNVVEVWHKFS